MSSPLSRKIIFTNRVARDISSKRSAKKNQLAHHLSTFYDSTPIVDPDTQVIVRPGISPPEGVDVEQAAQEIRLGGPVPDWATEFKEEILKNPRSETWYGIASSAILPLM